MRRKAFILAGVICFLLLAHSLVMSNVATAGTYLGEFKWAIKTDESESPENLVTGITHMGGDYFSIQGYLEPSDGDGIIICDGSAVLRNNTLYMTVHYTHTHTDSQYRDAFTWRINVDMNTLSGSFWTLGGSHQVEGRGTEYSDYYEGTIRLINQ